MEPHLEVWPPEGSQSWGPKFSWQSTIIHICTFRAPSHVIPKLVFQLLLICLDVNCTQNYTVVLLKTSRGSYIEIIPSYKPSVLLLLLLLQNCCMQQFRNCCTILDLCLKSEIMDRFWSSRCLNDRINVPDKIASFSSGATTSMVVKNGTKKTFEGFSKYS